MSEFSLNVAKLNDQAFWVVCSRTDFAFLRPSSSRQKILLNCLFSKAIFENNHGRMLWEICVIQGALTKVLEKYLQRNSYLGVGLGGKC